MKQIYLGIDIIEIKRIRQALSVWGDRFMRRIYTEKEIKLYSKRIESLAVRFAAKEAVFKALSQPGRYLSWQNVEIISTEDGRPLVTLSGEALRVSQEHGLKLIEVSLSHSKENAVAVVMGFAE